MENSPALLLRRHRLTETSLIVTWFSRDYGRIKTVARGALRPKSPFHARLDLFYLCEIQVTASRKSELHTLRDLSLIDAHEAIGRDYRKTQLASYFAALIDLATELDHPAPEIFDLLVRAFGYLRGEPANRRALEYFEAELARMLGVGNAASPSVALSRHLGRLPPERPALFDELPQS